MVWILKWWGICRMEFRRIIIFLIALTGSGFVTAQNEENKEPLQLRFDVFKEISLTTDFDFSSYINNDFILNYYSGGFIDESQKNDNFNRLNAEKNPFGISLNTKLQYRQLPETLFSKHNIGYSVAVQQNYYQELNFTQDAFSLAFYGNKMFSGSNANLSNMKFGNLSYFQIKAGLFWQNKDKFLEYGFQLSLNLGNQYQNFASGNAQLYTDSLGKSIQLNGNFENHQTDYLGNNFSKIQGIGSGVSLYIQKYKKQKYLFRLELNNLGFIHWNNKSSSYKESESIDFNGIEVANVFQMPNPLISTTAADTLQDYINANSTEGSFNSFTPSDFKIYGQYFLNEKISASALFNYRFNSVYKPLYQLGIQYHFSKKIFLGPNLNYGGYTKFNMGLDFRMKINYNFVLKLQTRYLSGFIVNQFSGFGAFLGINYKL